MASKTPWFTLFSFLLVFCFSFITVSSGKLHGHHSPVSKDTNPGQKIWCVGKPAAPDDMLTANLNYACGQKGVDCSEIQRAKSCFYPDTIVAHASYAMNMYYHAMGRNSWNCFFNNTGIVVFSDPSFGNCHYPAS